MKSNNKKGMTRRSLLAVALCSLIALQPAVAQPQSGTVTVVVPYPPGGGTDLIARVLGQALAAKWKRNVIIDNRPGAAGYLGTEHVARSKGDGTTLLLTDSTPIVIAPHLPTAKHKLNPLADLAPVALVARQTPVIVVNKDVPSKNIEEFIDFVKRNPGLPYGSIGSGSSFHIAMEQFQKLAGISMLHVPYKGTGPLLTDLVGGRVKAAMITLPSVNDFDRSGKLKILGVAGQGPAKGRRDLPVIGDSALPGFQVPLWFGLFAPSTTPTAILEKLHADVAQVLADPSFARDALNAQFLTAGKESRAQFSEIMKADDSRWADLIKSLNIQE